MNQLSVSQRPKLAAALKWGLAATAVIVIAPLTWMLVGGLVGIAVAGTLGLAIINFAPVVSMRLSNLRLKGLKNEAERNPIETLQLQQQEKENALADEAVKITAFDGAVETYRQSLIKEAETHPEAAQSGIPTLHQMERLLGFRRTKYKRAKADVIARRKKVELAESKYRVALAAQAVSKAAGETEGKVLDKILEDIAFTSVDDTVNTSLAALRTAVMVEEIPEDDSDAPAIRSIPQGLLADSSSNTDQVLLQLSAAPVLARNQG